jgi:IS30 family transposase
MSPVATVVERSTPLSDARRATGRHRAELVGDALAAAITTLPLQLTRSLTWDQGHEMAEHARFTVDTGVQVYFCDPKSPWQLSLAARQQREHCDASRRHRRPPLRPDMDPGRA